MQKQYIYDATLVKVVDGDTIDVLVDLGFNIHRQVRLRLANINAYEMKDEKGPMAKALAVKFFDGVESFQVLTEKDPGSYDRYTATVRKSEDTETLNDYMVREGGAVVYKYKWS